MSAYIVKTREAFIAQAEDAWVRLMQAGANRDMHLDEALPLDRNAAGDLIEALVALGYPVSPELQREYLVSVEQALGFRS